MWRGRSEFIVTLIPGHRAALPSSAHGLTEAWESFCLRSCKVSGLFCRISARSYHQSFSGNLIIRTQLKMKVEENENQGGATNSPTALICCPWYYSDPWAVLQIRRKGSWLQNNPRLFTLRVHIAFST